MLPTINKLLFDILEAIESIDSYLSHVKDFKTYVNNKMLRRAVEREFEIIGEALNRIERIDPNIDIAGKRNIVGMRNRIIHGYDKVDDEIVWGTIIRHLPLLKKDVNRFLNLK